MRTFYRCFAKALLFIVLFYFIALHIDSSKFISLDTSLDFAEWMFGRANQDNHDYLWFFSDVTLSLLSTIAAYHVVLWLYRRFRKNNKGR